jgi:L-amino acid N-acyltransferase YncA
MALNPSIEDMRREDWKQVRTLYAENAASLGLHRKAGFRDVGIRERCG